MRLLKSRTSGRCQQDRPAIGNDNGMLIMSRERPVRGFHGPTVAVFNGPGRILGNQWLDRDHKTIRKRRQIERIIGIGNDGVFMDDATDSMPRKLTDNPESLSRNLLLYGTADAIDRFACTSDGHCLFECRSGAPTQSNGFRGAGLNRNGYCCIRNVAVQFRGDIQAYNVTLFEHSITRNTVNDFVIDAYKIESTPKSRIYLLRKKY